MGGWDPGVPEAAGLTSNLKKCAVEQREVQYLGYHFGGGQVHPKMEKQHPSQPAHVLPQVHARKGEPDLVQWMEWCQAAFV